MTIKTTCRGLSLSAFAAALMIGAAPAAYAACEGAAAGSMAQDMNTGQQAAGASGETTTQGSATQGTAEQQAAAATGDMNASDKTAGEAMSSDIATDQGGATTDESGAVTAQSGGASGEAGATTQAQSGAGQAGTTAESGGQAADSPEIAGADEEVIQTMLEQEGYTEVSSIVSCGAYYEVEAMKDGQEQALQVDLATGRINPMQ